MDDASIAQCEIWFSRQFAENCDYRLLKKTSEVTRAKFDELRRTLQYVEASRASATKHMSLFQPATEARY
jgi:hypothetical protein